jgi:hypothetical protein
MKLGNIRAMTTTPDKARTTWLPLMLLLLLPVVVQAQDFTYTTNNGVITITAYTGTNAVLTIPNTINGLPVTTIAFEAFSSNSTLSSVVIPNSVLKIGDYAFLICSNLLDVTIGYGVTNIGNGAFSGCNSLAVCTIPNSVINIGTYAFLNCTSLTKVTIGNNVTNIGSSAFSGCSSLTDVTIGTRVASIEFLAFVGCNNLTSLTIPDSVTSIGTFAFSSCDSLTGVYFQGNAPSAGLLVFNVANNATVYYLPGTTGWGPTYGGRPTALWVLPNPLILDFGSSFGVKTNGFGFLISWATNIPVVVEASTSLADPIWSPIGTNTLTAGTSYFSDPQWTNYPGRYYRLRSP